MHGTTHDNLFDAIVDYRSNTGGFIVAAITVTFTAALELLSLPYVKKVLNQAGGGRLYLTAIFYNLLNNMVLGPVIWYFAVDLLCRPPLPVFECAWKTIALLGVHSLGYYMAHAAMHRPELYWAHKLHHKFHSNVTPVAAVCGLPHSQTPALQPLPTLERFALLSELRDDHRVPDRVHAAICGRHIFLPPRSSCPPVRRKPRLDEQHPHPHTRALRAGEQIPAVALCWYA